MGQSMMSTIALLKMQLPVTDEVLALTSSGRPMLWDAFLNNCWCHYLIL